MSTTLLIGSQCTEEVSALIIQKLGTIDDQYPIWYKAEAICLFFWYAVRQERGGDTNPFDATLRLAKQEAYIWHPGGVLWRLDISKIFVYASPRAAALVGPHIGFGL